MKQVERFPLVGCIWGARIAAKLQSAPNTDLTIIPSPIDGWHHVMVDGEAVSSGPLHNCEDILGRLTRWRTQNAPPQETTP